MPLHDLLAYTEMSNVDNNQCSCVTFLLIATGQSNLHDSKGTRFDINLSLYQGRDRVITSIKVKTKEIDIVYGPNITTASSVTGTFDLQDKRRTKKHCSLPGRPWDGNGRSGASREVVRIWGSIKMILGQAATRSSVSSDLVWNMPKKFERISITS